MKLAILATTWVSLSTNSIALEPQFPDWITGLWAYSEEACNDEEHTQSIRITDVEIAYYEGSDHLITVVDHRGLDPNGEAGRLLQTRLSYSWADGQEPERDVFFLLRNGELYVTEDSGSWLKSRPYFSCDN